MSGIEVATWNTEWISRSSAVFDRATERIRQLDSDILALTEVTTDLIPDGGHLILGGDDWGYPSNGERWKVALWSKWPITDHADHLLDPPGRHIAGTVGSPLGPIRVHAVCIPWRDAHVRSGRRDSRPWEEHLRFLNSLASVLSNERAAGAIDPDYRVILGDINQRSGRYPYRSDEVRKRWDVLCTTEDLTPATPEEIVDRIILGRGLGVLSAESLAPDGISDHHAVRCEIRPNTRPD